MMLPGLFGVPAIAVPGCLDMVNFYGPESIPAKFQGRKFYQHNPQATLMRTTPGECAQLGHILAQKLNASVGLVTVLIPWRGISVLSQAGQPFEDATADRALFEALKSGLRPEIPVVEMDCAINDSKFAAACACAPAQPPQEGAPPPPPPRRRGGGGGGRAPPPRGRPARPPPPPPPPPPPLGHPSAYRDFAGRNTENPGQNSRQKEAQISDKSGGRMLIRHPPLSCRQTNPRRKKKKKRGGGGGGKKPRPESLQRFLNGFRAASRTGMVLKARVKSVRDFSTANRSKLEAPTKPTQSVC